MMDAFTTLCVLSVLLVNSIKIYKLEQLAKESDKDVR